MQEFVGPVGVRVGAEDACHDELRVGKGVGQELHERDRATTADGDGRCAKVCVGRCLQRCLEVGVRQWCVPARAAGIEVEGHLDAVRRVPEEQVTEAGLRFGNLHRGRQAKREFHFGERAQHVAGLTDRRHAIHARDFDGRGPRVVDHHLFGIARLGTARPRVREHRLEVIAEHLARTGGLGVAHGGHLRLQIVGQYLAGMLVFDARHQLPQQTKA